MYNGFETKTKPKQFKNFQEASDANFNLVKDIFQKSSFKVIKPTLYNSVYDGIIQKRKADGTEDFIIIEVKIRNFDSDHLKRNFSNTLFMEQKKFKYLHKAADKLKFSGRNIKIWYLNKLSDGQVYIFDITGKKYKWKELVMNNVTYSTTIEKITKKITELNVENCDYKFKLPN
jgi:hypothetical protein